VPSTVARALAAGLAAAVAVVLLGGGDAFWVAVPAALAAAASARKAGAAALAAGLVALAAAAPVLASPELAPLPSPALVAFVLAASVAILHTSRARLEVDRSRLRQSALTDPLTRVANRRGFAERVEYEVARHARSRTRFSVVALDLDGFKLVNDRFGHAAGDEVLVDVAAALRATLRDQDTVARMGGDEFCVLAPETAGEGAHGLAARVERAVRDATAGLAPLSASVGLAIYPEDGDSGAAVVRVADERQMAAKRRHKRHLRQVA
jgi:diguanylate cyclase (GGDEF)-like protein